MKYQGIKHIITVCLGVCTLIACNDNLEIAPPSSIIPEDYLKKNRSWFVYNKQIYRIA